MDLRRTYLIISLKPHHNSCCKFIRGRSRFFLAFKHMDRIPWSCGCCISSLLYQNYSSEPMVQIPQVNRAEPNVDIWRIFTLVYLTPPSKYISLYWLNASFISISSFRRYSEGSALNQCQIRLIGNLSYPSSSGGSYLPDHGDLYESPSRL